MRKESTSEKKEHIRWDEKQFKTEMNSRFEDMESGKVKGVTLAAIELAAIAAYKNKNAETTRKKVDS